VNGEEYTPLSILQGHISTHYSYLEATSVHSVGPGQLPGSGNKGPCDRKAVYLHHWPEGVATGL